LRSLRAAPVTFAHEAPNGVDHSPAIDARDAGLAGLGKDVGIDALIPQAYLAEIGDRSAVEPVTMFEANGLSRAGDGQIDGKSDRVRARTRTERGLGAEGFARLSARFWGMPLEIPDIVSSGHDALASGA